MSERSTLNLLQLRRRPFVPTKRTEDYTGRLLRQVGLPDKATVGRLALGRSLAEPGHPPPLDGVASEGAGKAIRGDTLFGDDLAAWIALIVEHAAMTDRPEGIDTDALVDLVRRHWDRGAALIWKDWQEAGHQLWPFVERLATLAALPVEGSSPAVGEGIADPSEWNPSVIHPVLLRLGEIGSIEGSDRRAEWVLNANGRAPHLGMFGKPGKGKTRTAKQLFRQVREAAVPLLIIDPKGELREETAFVRDIGTEVIGLGREPIPLDALACEPGGEIRVADGFVEALEGAVPQLGPKQLDAAREIVKRLLVASGVVRFEDVVAEVDAHYARSDLKVDVLTASLHKLRDYALFAPTYAPKEFFAKTWVISVNEATDEARRVMEVAPPHLMEGLVLECRSKGLSCMFFSQSPDHMDRASDDIVKQLEVVASFEADVESKAVSRFFGSGRKPRDLQQLPTGHLLVRLPGEERAVVVKAWE